MKRNFVIIMMLVAAFAAQSQNALLSPRTALKVIEIRDGKCQSECVQAFVTLAEGVDLKALDAYGVKVNTVVGNRATAQIPVKRFVDFVFSGLCSYIDAAQQVYPLVDKVRADLGVDYIHQGINLPQGYDGSGVVVGVIDLGFEYGHPSFYDTTGTTLRIKRVWQQVDTSGTAPERFGYGSEYTSTSAILAAVTDNPDQGHASHVLGIAAGCGAPDEHGRRYSGIAPAADIVAVGCNMTDNGIIDGIRYIHEYARSVHKPCVINMSLGTMVGPHDGFGTFDIMMKDYLSGVDSLVAVVSAGNSGGTTKHLHKQFTATDTVVKTFMHDMITGEGYGFGLDCWGDEGSEFSVAISLYSIDRETSEHALVTTYPFVSSAVDTVISFPIITPADSIYNCAISVSHDNPGNHRPEVFVSISRDGRAVSGSLFALTVKATSGNVHVWSDEEDFFVRDNEPGFVWGDDEYSVSGVGANTDVTISVGSYVTRAAWVDEADRVYIFGSTPEGDRSTFSSHGPTYDGRVKPDISAPGERVLSAVNTTYSDFFNYDSTVFGGRSYYYTMMQGTSMAAPVVTGTVALWLQHSPGLDVDSVRTLIHNSARTDIYTGTLPESGSNLWGWGKIDAFGGLPATSVPMFQLDAATESFLKGHVSGGGRHPQGVYTITATATDGYRFAEWSDGVSNNSRLLNLTSDTALEARFVETSCDTISQFPWDGVFSESTLNCWDNIGPLMPWTLMNGMMVSLGSDGEVDNWLITPHINVAAQTALFCNIQGIGDSVAVVAITADGSRTVIDDNLYGRMDDGDCQVDLGAYAGQTIRIGFNHHYCGAYGIVKISNVKIDYFVGIDEIENSRINIKNNGQTLVVENPDAETVHIYDIAGRLLTTSKQSVFTFHLPASGVYIVKAGDGKPHKVVAVKH